MKTIAQQLNIKDFPFQIKNKNSKEIYYEDLDGYWFKREYNSQGNQIYFETSENYWAKKEYDSEGHVIYFEDSDGEVRDNRPKPVPEYTMEQLTQMLGKEFKIKK